MIEGGWLKSGLDEQWHFIDVNREGNWLCAKSRCFEGTVHKIPEDLRICGDCNNILLGIMLTRIADYDFSEDSL